MDLCSICGGVQAADGGLGEQERHPPFGPSREGGAPERRGLGHVGRVTALDLVLGVFRLVLGVFALLWLVGVEDSNLMLSAPVIWLIVALFCIYALLVAGLTQQRPGSANVVYGASAFMDLSFVTFLVHISGGADSPFCATYVLIAAVHTLYFGLGFGLLLGLSSSVLCSMAVLSDTESVLPPIRSAYYVTLPLLTAFCAGVVRARRDAMIRQGRSRPEDSCAALVRRMLALHVLSHADAPPRRRLELLDGLMGAVLQDMGLIAYACYVVDESRKLRCIASRGLSEEALRHDAAPAELPVPDEGAKPAVFGAREGLGAELFDFMDDDRGTWACAPIRSGDDTIGLILAASQDRIRPDMLDALTAAADQLALDIQHG